MLQNLLLERQQYDFSTDWDKIILLQPILFVKIKTQCVNYD